MASNKGKQPAPKLDQGPDDQLLFDDKELDRIFNQEASLVQREQEVVRVLAAFKLNPYDILDLDHMPGANAQIELSDSTKRKNLDETLQDARMLVLREVGLPRDAPDDHELLRPPKMRDPDLRERVRRKAKEIIIDDELRKRRLQKMTMIAEGAEAKRQEDALAERKRKAEEKERWEETREDRVHDWRNFNKKKKKTRKGPEVLG
ncbi:chaperone regulator [Rhodotorula diobovata]|uniref:Chaperone regulator n=1 Tax=Rhodotorula diobovata TaxID=5288 RepID=A0A5C5FML8_9BASI|nr:chaperone regulator [Rhodotorula diobovata]